MIDREVIVNVRKTRKGAKVTRMDGESFSEGTFTMHTYRYFYGDNLEERATDYANQKCEELKEKRDCPVSVREIGEYA